MPNGHAQLQLILQQVADHLTSSNARGSPQCREVQGAGESIGVTEEEHRRDPTTGVLEREARLIHLVLLDLAADQVVHAASRVDLGFELAGDVGELGSLENVEVVVGGVTASMSFSSDGGTCGKLNMIRRGNGNCGRLCRGRKIHRRLSSTR